jgi:predicted AlkP superfamily phosphohydrolase/phosphomutase
MQEWDWDLFMVVFRNSDEVTHFMWRYTDCSHPLYPGEGPYQDAILQYYQRVDEWIAEMYEAAGPGTALLVVSDHGAGPLYKDVFLNEWLRQEGFLRVRAHQGLLHLLTAALRGTGLTRSSMGATLSKLGLHRVRATLGQALESRLSLIPNDERPRLDEAVDWSRTQAYSTGYIGQIYINLKGREPQGIVAPGGEYEALRGQLISRLYELRDPEDGGRVVDAVRKREEMYDGPYAGAGADLLVSMRGLSYITRDGYELATGGSIFSSPMNHESGGHRPQGVLMALGPTIAPGTTVASARIVDAMPSILHMLGCVVPRNLDGRTIPELFPPGHLAEHPPQYAELPRQVGLAENLWSEEEEREVMERLRRLGYLG